MSKSEIFIVHGWSYDTSKWRPIVEHLESTGYKVNLLKVPGLTGQELKQAWTIDDYVNWLKDCIGKKPAILIGHSNGGRIIMNLVIKYPELAEKIILIDAAGIPRTELSQKLKRGVFKAAAKTGKVITKNQSARKLLYKLSRTSDYKQASPVMRTTMVNLLESDKNLDASKIKTPTSIIWGQDDTATPAKDAQKLNRQIKNSTLKVIIGAKHSPQFTHTAEVLAELARIVK